MIELNKLSKEIYEGNKRRGFDVKEENIGQTLMLIVSELSEALEADRKNKRAQFKRYENILSQKDQYKDYGDFMSQIFELHIKDTFEDEIADALIRLLDLCGALEIDIERNVELKLQYNKTRIYKHGKRY